MRGQPPAQEDLIIGKGTLGINDRRLGHCWKRQRGQSGPGHRPGAESGAGRKEEAAGAGGLSVGEGAWERNFLGTGWAGQGPKEKEVGEHWAGAGAQSLVLVCHYSNLA